MADFGSYLPNKKPNTSVGSSSAAASFDSYLKRTYPTMAKTPQQQAQAAAADQLAKTHPFNPKNPAYNEFNTQLDLKANPPGFLNKASGFFDNILSGIKTGAKMIAGKPTSIPEYAQNPITSLIKQYTQPSDLTKQAEQALQKEAPNQPITQALGKVILRTLIPIGESTLAPTVGETINQAGFQVGPFNVGYNSSLAAKTANNKNIPTLGKTQTQSVASSDLVTHKLSADEVVKLAIDSINTGFLIAPFFTGLAKQGTLKLSEAISKESRVPISYSDLQKITTATSDADAIARVGSEKFNAYKDATKTNTVRQALKDGYVTLAENQPTTFSNILKNAATRPITEIANFGKTYGAKIKVPETNLLPEKTGIEATKTSLDNFLNENKNPTTPIKIETQKNNLSITDNKPGEYPTIHQGGIIKMVKGEPIKIVDGVDTFLHKGNDGWVVSESTTGRYLAESKTKEGAIAKANFEINNVGVDKFKQLISEKQLPKSSSQNLYSDNSKKIAKIFDKSTNQQIIAKKNGVNFELGSFGKNHQIRKLGEVKNDRFPESELPKTIENIKQSYRASDNPKNYRYDNIVHIAEMPNGESRAIITRQNFNGAEEVISWHKINLQKNPNYIKSLESFGSPEGNRTPITGLEDQRSNPLSYGTNKSITNNNSSVNTPETAISSKVAEIPKGQESLYQEARKYKSAEEFVKAQGQTVYRGGTKLDVSKINDEGLPVTFDNKVAEQFARSKNQFAESPAGQIMGYQKGQNVVESYQLSSTAKIATRSDIPDNVFNVYKQANPLTKPELAEPIITKWAKENGYDAIDFRTLGKTSAKEAEIKVLNPDILKTKSQLTDIWKKAHQEQSPTQTPQTPAEAKTPSKIATSIEQKAIEQKLTQGFDGIAGYDKITIKDQAEKAAKVMENPDEALNIIRGDKPLPDGLRGTALITAAEEYIRKLAM